MVIDNIDAIADALSIDPSTFFVTLISLANGAGRSVIPSYALIYLIVKTSFLCLHVYPTAYALIALILHDCMYYIALTFIDLLLVYHRIICYGIIPSSSSCLESLQLWGWPKEYLLSEMPR